MARTPVSRVSSGARHARATPSASRPDVRARTLQENSTPTLNREPNGGASGPDTCKQGFVWREAFDGDTICVTPGERAQTKADNAAAASRRQANAPKPTDPNTPKPTPTAGHNVVLEITGSGTVYSIDIDPGRARCHGELRGSVQDEHHRRLGRTRPDRRGHQDGRSGLPHHRRRHGGGQPGRGGRALHLYPPLIEAIVIRTIQTGTTYQVNISCPSTGTEKNLTQTF